MEQLDSQLPAADVTLDPAVLDRLDELVQPGVTLILPTPATASRSSTRRFGDDRRHRRGRATRSCEVETRSR